MRQISRFAVSLGLLALTACSDPRPPVGRWEGAYEDPGVIIVARLEIDSAGNVRVSAPNAITDAAPVSDGERAVLHTQLQTGLAESWPSVAPLPLVFDGRVFHKRGGVAPQLEWDKAHQRMILVFYSGNRASIRVPLDSVQNFTAS